MYWNNQALWLPLVLLLLGLWLFKRRGPQAALYATHSYTAIRHTQKKSLQVFKVFSLLPWVAIICLVMAFCDIRIPWKGREDQHSSTPKEQADPLWMSREGIALYLLLDVSGSMREEVLEKKGDKGLRVTQRLDVLKHVGVEFIQHNQRQDLIGLMSFARVPRILSPLTFDTEFLVNQVKTIQAVKHPKHNGTAIGYAIYKAATLMEVMKHYHQDKLSKEERPDFDIYSQAIVLITDGVQEYHPEDQGHPLRALSVQQAGKKARELGIHLYIINVNEQLAQPVFASQLTELSTAAKASGGNFYFASDKAMLSQILQHIQTLERKALPVKEQVMAKVQAEPQADTMRDLGPGLLIIAWLTLSVYILLDTLYFKRITL